MPPPAGHYIVKQTTPELASERGSAQARGRWTLYHMPVGCTHPTRIASYPSKRDATAVAYLLAGRVDNVIVS